MKKTLYLFLFAALFCVNAVYSQFGPDVIIQSDTTNQRRVEIATAFNGWMFAAHAEDDVASDKGGITITKSTDGGYTWTVIDSYFPTGIRYVSHDIVVSGTTDSTLVVTLAGVNYNVSDGTYVIFVDRYDGNTGTFLGSTYNLNKGLLKVYDVELASDSDFPAVGSSPYSVSLLYSSYTPTLDSIVCVTSVDGGLTFTNRQVVATTGQYFRNVSLDYGRSSSASNGRYFAAWERLPSSTARTGNIYTSRHTSTIDGGWIAPINLDSVSTTMIGLCRNPRIAISRTLEDNDSNSLSAVVLVDRDYNGDASDYDLLGFSNRRAHYTNFWYRLDVRNTSSNDMTPDIVFDDSNKVFRAVFFDSTLYNLTYASNEWNLVNPSSWTIEDFGMNDDSLASHNPYPRITYRRTSNEVGLAWVDEAPNGDGVVKFDIESFMFAGVEEQMKELNAFLYPNPVKNTLHIELEGEATTSTVTVMDLNGRLVRTLQLDGQTLLSVDVDNLTSGTYLLRIENANGFASAMFVKE